MKDIISKAFENRELLDDNDVKKSIYNVIDQLDKGIIRVAEPQGEEWVVNEWAKKAILLYFLIQKVEKIEIGPFVFNDKIPLKRDYDINNIRRCV